MGSIVTWTGAEMMAWAADRGEQFRSREARREDEGAAPHECDRCGVDLWDDELFRVDVDAYWCPWCVNREVQT